MWVDCKFLECAGGVIINNNGFSFPSEFGARDAPAGCGGCRQLPGLRAPTQHKSG